MQIVIYVILSIFARECVLHVYTNIPAILREREKRYTAHTCIYVPPGRKKKTKTKIGFFSGLYITAEVLWRQKTIDTHEYLSYFIFFAWLLN